MQERVKAWSALCRSVPQSDRLGQALARLREISGRLHHGLIFGLIRSCQEADRILSDSRTVEESQCKMSPDMATRSQVSAGRPIPILAQHTFPGNVILSPRATSGLAPPSLPDSELEKMCLAHLAGAACSPVSHAERMWRECITSATPVWCSVLLTPFM